MILNPIPPDPEPTNSEIKIELARLNRAGWRLEKSLLRRLARIYWISDNSRKYPDRFAVYFASNVPDYNNTLNLTCGKKFARRF